MQTLLYKDDFNAARDRLTKWWNGENIGRPAMQIRAKRPVPAENIPKMAPPEGWLTFYSTSNFNYRVNLALTGNIDNYHLAEAFPAMAPDLAPNCLALYLGCKGVEQPGTVWCQHFIEKPEEARFTLDPHNFYWDFTLRLAAVQLRDGKGKFLTAFPDLIEGLDTLAAMRDSQALLIDLIERPEWVSDCLQQITARYFDVYDPLYALIKDDRGGSHFWAWAPGRLAKLQCDFSAMISPAMFGEFMVPVLTEMTRRLDYSIYHWDGPGALSHHDHLLSLPDLDMIQWTPGSGIEPATDKRWWPYFHKTIEAGKKVMLTEFKGEENLHIFKQEFGPKLNQFMISMRADSPEHAERLLDIVREG